MTLLYIMYNQHSYTNTIILLHITYHLHSFQTDRPSAMGVSFVHVGVKIDKKIAVIGIKADVWMGSEKHLEARNRHPVTSTVARIKDFLSEKEPESIFWYITKLQILLFQNIISKKIFQLVVHFIGIPCTMYTCTIIHCV